MRILFDQGTPAPLRRALVRHNVSTAFEMAWAELDNGALLKAAEDQFDVLITTDRKLRFQQNLTARQLAILVLPATSWPEIQRHEVEIATTVDRMQAGDFVEMDFAWPKYFQENAI